MLHTRKLWSLVAVLMVLALLVAACQPAAQPTQAPAQPTKPPAQPTEPPAQPTEPAAQPTEAPMSQWAKYEAPDCEYGGLVKSIEAVDATTVKFTMCAPDPAFPSKVAFSSVGINSAAHLEKTGGKPLEDALGTGPYMVKEWKRGDQLVLEANPNYWGEAPKTKTVIFKWNPEAAARLTALQAGEVDGFDNPDSNDFETISGDTTLNLIPREALNIMYLGLNNTKPPLDNEQVRQALAYGIDRQAIVDKFYPKGSIAASHFTPCAIPGGCEGAEWYAYDPAKAKELLTEAGFADGFKISLAYRDVVRGYLPTPGKVAEEIQAQLKELGIEATIDQQEGGTFLDNASNGNLEMFLLGWSADYPDATNFLDSHFGVGANDSFGKKWDDVTAALVKAASLSDQDERNKLYAEANEAIRTHVPMIPVAHGGSATAWKAAVEGAHSSPLSNESMKVLEVPGQDTFVWMQNAEPLSLYCADETDGESLRACEQVFESLLAYKIGSTEVEPSLAEKCEANTDLTEWTCTLRSGVKFSDGTPLTAEDVVASYAVQWDAAHPLHVGNTGNFDYWTYLFTAFLNPPPATP
ncbi:Periplasmic dipeptide transport protein [Thermoflexales bacterium]|nr:Periplasmic dipeptide transport protein [Thermoflexales bacterium]